MGLFQKQNMTLDFKETDVTFKEVTTASSAVNSTIIVLGVLTFALQLCLVLLFMLRCWSLERRVQEALEQPDSDLKCSELQYFNLEGYKQDTCFLYNDSPGISLRTTSSAMENYKYSTDYPQPPSLPWDLVQN